MSEPPRDEFEEKLLRERIRQLRETLDSLADGQAVFSEPAEDMPPEMELAFLERVLAFETAGRTTWLKRLEEKGYLMPPPESLTDDELGLELWQVIQHLAELRVFLYSTDHLSEQELYRELYNDLLVQETLDLDMGEDSACHLDVVGSGSEEDTACWLRYYADDETRQEWIEQFPDYTLPPRETPPYDRDRFLPKREGLEHDPLEGAITALLTFADWTASDGPFRLSTNLQAAEVSDIEIFRNCRVLLETLHEAGRVKATANLGDLPRAFNKKVNEALPELPHHDLPPALRDNTNNERSIPRVHQARLLCKEAGLLRKHRGHFMLTRKGESMLAPEKAGILYRDLFVALFRDTNLAYFDYLPELPILQQTIALTLWRLSFVARHWIDLDELPVEVLLPSVQSDLLKAETQYLSGADILGYRIIDPLAAFGLVEKMLKKEKYFTRTKAIRLTPLFDRFLSFHVGP